MAHWHTYYTTNSEKYDTIGHIQSYGGDYNCNVAQSISCTSVAAEGVISTTNTTASSSTTTGSIKAAGGLGVAGAAYIGSLNCGGNAVVTGTLTANSKSFDIKHPTKEGKRLLYGCLEGPEHAVYVRGRLSGNNVIELPDYWEGLVDLDTVTVQLTQIGTSQDLMIGAIDGRNITVKSGNGTIINCYFTVTATRKDVPDLEVEQDA